jgi:hypothetical protein
MSLEKLGTNKYVEHPRFVGYGKKDHACGCTWSLFHDGKSGGLHIRAVCSIREVRSPQITSAMQFLPSKPHGMRASRHTAYGVVRHKPFFRGHCSQWRFCRIFAEPLTLLHEQWPFGFACAFDLPKCVPPVRDTIKAI